MKRTITIAPVSRAKGTTVILHGKYINTKLNKTVNILTNGNVIFEECGQGEKTKNIAITDQNPEFTFTWNDSAESDDLANAKGILEAHAWSKSSEIECPGNDNLVRPMFKMVDKTEKVSTDVKLLKQKGRVYNIITNFSTKKMRDIAFFVGLNPINDSPEEIFLKLIDFEKGKLMEDPAQFINTLTTPDMNYIVVAKKAILYNIIETKEKQYYINTELIGGSFNDVLAYCKSYKQQFDFITKEVSKVDVLPVDIDWDEPVKDIIGMTQKIEQPIEKSIEVVKEKSDAEADKEKDSNMDELKAIGKKLGIKSWQVMGKERLVEEIEKVKERAEYPVLEEEPA